LEKSVNVYRGIIEDLKHQIESLNIKVQELEDKVDELMEENHNLKRKHIL
jgi:regulator of replication initiation timing